MMSTFRRADGFVSTTPVGYVWDGMQIRVSTLRSRMKCKDLMADPRLTFCVLSRLEVTHYVEIRGYATIEADPDRSFWKKQFKEGYRIMYDIEDADPPSDLDPAEAERVIVTLHPTQVACPNLYDGRLAR
jgi:PPOX class probable F420-dependent enzyme